MIDFSSISSVSNFAASSSIALRSTHKSTQFLTNFLAVHSGNREAMSSANGPNQNCFRLGDVPLGPSQCKKTD